MAGVALQTATNRRAVRGFLEQEGLAHYQLQPEVLLADYLREMEQGLADPSQSSLKMIPTYISSEPQFWRNRAAVVLDMGGTNLRSALVTVPDTGQPIVEHFCQQQMPALEEPLSAAQFLAEVVEFVQPVLQAYRQRYGTVPLCLGFCFSYPSQIALQENGDLDGKLLQWSKEVKAPELVGQYVGHRLLAALREQAEAPQRVCLINDTVATLLAGQAVADEADFADFIGYILGTGINSCHAEPSSQVAQLDPRYLASRGAGRVIVNAESGNYDKFPHSQIERAYDATTQNPGCYWQEKASSGRYWGELVSCVLRAAAREGVLPPALGELPLQSSASLNAVLHHPSRPSNLQGQNRLQPSGWVPDCLSAWLEEHQIDDNARERIYFLTEAMLERSALFTAVNISACILRSGGGLSPLRPVCLTVDGSAFYALHGFVYRVSNWLDHLLSGQNQRYYRLKKVEHGPLLGAAIAALHFGSP